MNLTAFVSGILISFPVPGTLATLGALVTTSKLPKPIKLTFSPAFRASSIASIVASITAFTSFLLKPHFPATAEINYDFFIFPPFLYFKKFYSFFYPKIKSFIEI